MNPLRQLLLRLRAPTKKQAWEADMAEEMRLHLAHRVEKNVADGMSPTEARYAAQRKFGGIEQAKEAARDARGTRWISELGQDLRYARRNLTKAPTHAIVAVLILGLGVGITTALFNVAYALLLNPFPYPRVSEMWAADFRGARTGQFVGIRPRDHEALTQLPGISAAMASTWTMGTLVTGSSAEFVKVVHMSESAFDFLGLPPALGRGLGPGDVQPSGEPAPVTVISHQLWQRLYQGDPAVIGRTLKLNDRLLVIVGVAAPRFTWKTNDGLWIPMSPRDSTLRWVNPTVRLKPGVMPEEFRVTLAAFIDQLVQSEPARFPPEGVTVALPNQRDLNVARGDLSASLHLLGYAVGFLLLIACANVANLQLARSASRSREFAIRLAMGAGRSRLIRQLLTESLALSMIGGLVGVILAFGLTRLIVTLIPPVSLPTEADVTMNAVVLGFSVGISVLTGVLFGLAPALQCTRSTPADALKDGDHATGSGEGARQKRLRSTLVVIEVALSVILLIGASLTIRGFVELQSVDAGFHPEQTLLLNLHQSPSRLLSLEASNHFSRELLQRVQAIPGVESVSIGMLPSMEGRTSFSLSGFTSSQRSINVNLVSAGYRHTLGIPLLQGRDLAEAEVNQSSRVALINEAAVKLWPPGTNPVGQQITVRWLSAPVSPSAAPETGNAALTVVGVVGDTRNLSLRGEVQPALFFPYSLISRTQRSLVVRAMGKPSDLLSPIRAEIRALDPEQALSNPQTAQQVIGLQTVQPRLNMALFSGLAGLGLALACAGIYSVLSYHVAQRSREFGVRLALGAKPADLRRMMLREGGGLLVLGIVTGLACTLALAPFISSRVFLVPLLDPVALLTASAVLGTTALLACLLPAGQAMKVNPLVALRHE